MPSSSIMGWVQVGPDRVRRGHIRNTRNMVYSKTEEVDSFMMTVSVLLIYLNHDPDSHVCQT